MSPRPVYALAALLSACASTSPEAPSGSGDAGSTEAQTPPPGDAGTDAPASALWLEVGVGPPGQFRTVTAGDFLELQRGCQGAQHIFTGLRTRAARDASGRVVVRVLRKEDGAIVSALLDQRLAYETDPEPGVGRLTGLRPVVEVPRDIVDKTAVVEVTLEDATGMRATGRFEGVVRWGADSCGTH